MLRLLLPSVSCSQLMLSSAPCVCMPISSACAGSSCQEPAALLMRGSQAVLCCREGLKFSRRLAEADAFSAITNHEVHPGKDVQASRPSCCCCTQML